MLQIGDIAPDFTLPCVDAAGEACTFSLAAVRPHQTVLFFYPRDLTETCTREAQDFSRLSPALAASGTRLVGISKDSLATHRRFLSKQDLQLTLASDNAGVCEQFGAWGPKVLYGKAYVGIVRTTFLIDGAGRIAAAWRVTKVNGHAEAVLAACKAGEN